MASTAGVTVAKFAPVVLASAELLAVANPKLFFSGIAAMNYLNNQVNINAGHGVGSNLQKLEQLYNYIESGKFAEDLKALDKKLEGNSSGADDH